MKHLFTLDIKDYPSSAVPVYRPSARAIIRAEDEKLAMVYSRKYGYYKFPGGGICSGEDRENALAREVCEETGLIVKKETIQEYANVLRRQKSGRQENTVFVQENFYYFCSAEAKAMEQKMDGYEKEAGFELRFVTAKEAIAANQACVLEDDFSLVSIARDTQVLERFIGAVPEPSVCMAEFLLRSAVECNPGPWEQHSRYTAESAERIAGQHPDMDAKRAYVYGLLHDIGRKFGVSYLAHVYDGYHYLLELGYANAARIALTHSFNLKDIHDYIGKFDLPESAQEEIQTILEETEYDDYDYLIQLCDAVAKADGIVSLEERMNDVKSRYGYYPQKKWDRNLWLKEYFEGMTAIRNAGMEDAERILEIYAHYVKNTAITFEYEVPTLDEFQNRIKNTRKRYPYLVIERDGAIQGYAYAGPFVGRAAYDWSCETTIYLAPAAQKCGMGRKIYEALEDRLREMGILNLYACIGYPEQEDEYLSRNSADFHAHLGFKKVGEFHKCGYKFGRWYNMIWMEKIIGEHQAEALPVGFPK